jgi:hypothetical protein
MEVIIVQVRGKQRENQSRLNCLRFLAQDHVDRQVQRLVIDRDDSHVESDRQLIRRIAEKAEDPDRMRYDHLRGFEEPLLTIPDAVAWCWARRSLPT